MTESLALAVAGSFVLAGFHGLTSVLRAMPGRYLSTLNSVAAGAGLAYVFLYLLFELVQEGAAKIHTLAPLGPAPLETLFLILLLALSVTFVVQMHFESTPVSSDDHRGYALLFLTYNILAGAGLLEEAVPGPVNLAFYVAAIGVHLLFNDLFLLHRYPADHKTGWRLALAAAPICGTGLAVVLGISDALLYVALALVAGGTLPIALRREIPEARHFRSIAFMAGLAGYAVLIFATWRF